jgi:hypothetical protein
MPSSVIGVHRAVELAFMAMPSESSEPSSIPTHGQFGLVFGSLRVQTPNGTGPTEADNERK